MSQKPTKPQNPEPTPPENPKRLKPAKKKKIVIDKQPPKKKLLQKPKRLISLDAYRGFIMMMLAASGFGIAKLAAVEPNAPVWNVINFEFWQSFAFQFEHPQWISQFSWVGVSFWDLIQPAFMFMVGVAMPFSYRRRGKVGHSQKRQVLHALWRAVVLVLMGVFLYSVKKQQTNWIFFNVLAQIGLGYFFLYLLMSLRWWIKGIVFALILVGYTLLFYTYQMPENFDHDAMFATEDTQFDGRFAPWSKNANTAAQFDRWFLNLFPRPVEEPFEANHGGYTTLNFIPSIATMLLGVFCGQLLLLKINHWKKFGYLILMGGVCMGLGIAAGYYVCPIVKRIWTPSWVLYSGAYVIWLLAMFFLLFDIFKIKYISFPLVVVGMNSIAIYMLGHLLQPWTISMIKIHFAIPLTWLFGPNLFAANMYGPLVEPTLTFLVFWLILYWMYRQKYFVRV